MFVGVSNQKSGFGGIWVTMLATGTLLSGFETGFYRAKE
jgi:hypothetical protein